MAIQDRDTLKALITSTLPDNLTKDISAAVLRAVVNNICDSVIFYNENAAKQNVRVATTANGTLVSSFEDGDTVDGVTLATGDRILLKDQSAASQNGIYTVNASGAPTRATDFDSADDISLGNTFYVTSGTANAGKFFYLSSPTGTITIGSSNLGFTDLANSAADASTTTKGLVELATTAETTTGTDATRAVTPNGLSAYVAAFINGGNTGTFTKIKTKVIEIGDWDMDSSTSIDVAHGLTNTSIRDVKVVIRDDAGTLIYPLDRHNGTEVQGGVSGYLSSNIRMYREVGGIFDSTNYDSTSYNRGWITITYED